jgi:hypothetical protein
MPELYLIHPRPWQVIDIWDSKAPETRAVRMDIPQDLLDRWNQAKAEFSTVQRVLYDLYCERIQNA